MGKMKKEKGKCDCCGGKVSLKKLTWDENHCAFVCDNCLVLGSFDDDDFASDDFDDYIENYIEVEERYINV